MKSLSGTVRTVAENALQANKMAVQASAAASLGGAKQVNEAGAFMDEIVSRVQSVTQLIGEISSATAERRAVSCMEIIESPGRLCVTGITMGASGQRIVSGVAMNRGSMCNHDSAAPSSRLLGMCVE